MHELDATAIVGTGARHAIDLPARQPAIQLAYWEWYPGGIPVLLLHGMGDCGLVWARLATDLGDRYHCLAPDLRGHGDSSKPVSGYGCADIIADLEALLDGLGWTSAHVIAHSWSAKVAAVWARQAPDRLRSLVLVDPFFIRRFPAWTKLAFPILYRALPFLKMMGPFASEQEAVRQAQQLKQFRGWSALQQAVFQATIAPQPDGRWASKFTMAARDGIFDDALYVEGLTQPIALPTLFVQPRRGLNRTAWQLRPFQQYIPHMEMCRVEGNHWCFMVEPAEFNRAIADFLARQP